MNAPLVLISAALGATAAVYVPHRPSAMSNVERAAYGAGLAVTTAIAAHLVYYVAKRALS